ncbi:MAG: hypothetical protein WAV20_13150, partial [Blastocatellia bacterium]
VEVLVSSRAEEEGFVQGHTRGNHVALVKGLLAPGIHQVRIAHATPNRLYCTTGATEQNAEPTNTQLPTALYQLSLAV